MSFFRVSVLRYQFPIQRSSEPAGLEIQKRLRSALGFEYAESTIDSIVDSA